MRALALCADDYGLSLPISRGIEQLAAAGRLTDVSCIVNAPVWTDVARRLVASNTRVGLHLNLTEGRPLSSALAAHWPVLPTLPRLIALAHLGRLPVAPLRVEWQTQLDVFEQARGHAPSHLDGHQHVHHLPQLRDLLLSLLATRPGLKARHTGRVRGPGFAVKRWLIERTGGGALGRALEARGLAQNRVLLGVYDFRGESYRGLMQGWLANLPPAGGLVFCHPGEVDDGHDAIAPARQHELAYLGSAAFDDDLAAAGARLDLLRA